MNLSKPPRIPPQTQTGLREEIAALVPRGEQEAADRSLMLHLLDAHSDLLTRKNTAAHFTGSSWIVNRERTKVLMVYHDMYKSWSWTGGHADGEADLLSVAMREAMEETGLSAITTLSDRILALDVLPVWSHRKRGRFVSTHLHLNLSWLLEAEESAPIRMREGENSGVMWVAIDEVNVRCTEPDMLPVYARLTERMRGWCD